MIHPTDAAVHAAHDNEATAVRAVAARRACTFAAMLLAAAGVVGCGAVPTAGETAAPTRTGTPAPPPLAGSQAPSSAPTGSPAPSAVGDVTVRPGEVWIASQRLVDPDNDPDALGIFLVRPDGTGDHQLLPELDGRQMHPAWSPDGEQLAFIQEHGDGIKELWVARADGLDARRVARCERPCNNMISPDWRAADPGGIYVGRDEGLSKFMLSRLDLDTGVMTDVVVRQDGATAESWRLSPDGTHALVVRDILADDRRAALSIVELATGVERRLTPYDYSLDRADWMPDGRIVFNAPSLADYNTGDAGPANLWVMDADGANLAQLTRYSERNSGATQPHVLADGSGIAFTKVLDGTPLRPMAVVDLDGGNERYLTPDRHRGSHIDVRPVP